MMRYIVKRLGQTVITAIFVTMIVFGLARLTGDPALATFAAWLQARIADGPGSYRLDAAGARG